MNNPAASDGVSCQTTKSLRRKRRGIGPEEIEVAVANGKTTPLACREGGITEQTYYRWRKEYGGLQVDQARCLKELEQENSKLKRLVAELSLDKLVLKDIASGNF
jgi:transposase-like protein